ncbi:GNAT family N-acetyltransferase [Rhodohalobacter sp.]|uniref:GNAT family N-acetyltransferase n=1 Tax=Rhodohalobacter sp. TaxID=1974210 RepID=UPI002ACE5BAF|nr:GNAT family N-acetyltransferase [Rhodohalobacter sp.]MDZ7755217.1 GNAT family N-acetyltransferase [Rhodohalobacter sp.]
MKPVENDNIKTIVRWMMDEQNYRWFDFGRGVQKLAAPALKIDDLTDNEHELRIFTCDETDKPIGLISLSDINKKFKTATLWFVLGDKNYTGQNYTTKAVSSMLTMGFEELKLESIFAWVIEKNVASIKVLEKNNFKFIGKRRRCHYINGHAYDRLQYDILAGEHNMLQNKAADDNLLTERIKNLLNEEFEVEIPSTDTKLIENGFIDSLRFIQLMSVLEDEFEITVSIEDLDLERFSTVKNISKFVQKRLETS